MSWKKDEIVRHALEELGIPQMDAGAQEIESGVNRLNLLLAGLNAEGIRLGAPLSNSPKDLTANQSTDIPDWAVRAVITNLALDLAPSYGKTPAHTTLMAASQGKSTLRGQTGYPVPNQVLSSNLPRGAGNRRCGISRTFVGETDKPLLAGNDSELEL